MAALQGTSSANSACTSAEGGASCRPSALQGSARNDTVRVVRASIVRAGQEYSIFKPSILSLIFRMI